MRSNNIHRQRENYSKKQKHVDEKYKEKYKRKSPSLNVVIKKKM